MPTGCAGAGRRLAPWTWAGRFTRRGTMLGPPPDAGPAGVAAEPAIKPPSGAGIMPKRVREFHPRDALALRANRCLKNSDSPAPQGHSRLSGRSQRLNGAWNSTTPGPSTSLCSAPPPYSVHCQRPPRIEIRRTAALCRQAVRVERKNLRVVQADQQASTVGYGIRELMPVVVWPTEPPRGKAKARHLVLDEEGVDSARKRRGVSRGGHPAIIHDRVDGQRRIARPCRVVDTGSPLAARRRLQGVAGCAPGCRAGIHLHPSAIS